MTSIVLMLVNLNLIENLSKDKDRLEAQQLTFEPLNTEPKTAGAHRAPNIATTIPESECRYNCAQRFLSQVYPNRIYPEGKTPKINDHNNA
jgi:hypothetical protein